MLNITILEFAQIAGYARKVKVLSSLIIPSYCQKERCYDYRGESKGIELH